MKKICNIYNIPSHYRLKIYKMLDEHFDCTFVFGDTDEKVKTFDLLELKNARIEHVTNRGAILFQPGILRYVFQKYDSYILTLATNNLTQWLLLLLLKLSKKKVYGWTHGLYGYESSKQLLIRKLMFKLTDGLFVYGDYATELIKQKGYLPSKKIFPIHNSLDYDSQLLIRNSIRSSSVYKKHFGNNNPTLIFIGRLTKVKRLDMIIASLRILKAGGKDFNLVFVGDGTERESLGSLALDAAIEENVWFYGACYDEIQNAELIFNADLCISPGNVGLTALHSMMFGTPVITHDDFAWQMPEFETIQRGVTGDFFKKGDIHDLARTIDNWFANHKNRELVRDSCYSVIDKEWNPYYQLKLLKKVIE